MSLSDPSVYKLTHISLNLHPGKQNNPRCDAAKCGVPSHHGNISVEKLPQICTYHIVNKGEIWGCYQKDEK